MNTTTRCSPQGCWMCNAPLDAQGGVGGGAWRDPLGLGRGPFEAHGITPTSRTEATPAPSQPGRP